MRPVCSQLSDTRELVVLFLFYFLFQQLEGQKPSGCCWQQIFNEKWVLHCIGEHYLRAQSSLFISKICYFTIFLSPCLFVLLFWIHIKMTVFTYRNYFPAILSLPSLLLNTWVPQLRFSSDVSRLKTQENFNIRFFFSSWKYAYIVQNLWARYPAKGKIKLSSVSIILA